MVDRPLTQRILVPLGGSDIATVVIPCLPALTTPGCHSPEPPVAARSPVVRIYPS